MLTNPASAGVAVDVDGWPLRLLGITLVLSSWLAFSGDARGGFAAVVAAVIL